MILSENEFEVLWQIEEGTSDPSGISSFTSLDEDVIKKILRKLHKLKLIELTVKFDEYYKEEFWHAITTPKAKKLFKETA